MCFLASLFIFYRRAILVIKVQGVTKFRFIGSSFRWRKYIFKINMLYSNTSNSDFWSARVFNGSVSYLHDYKLIQDHVHSIALISEISSCVLL